MGNKLNGEDGQQALLDIQQLQQGEQPNLPQNPTAEYLDAFNNFLQSPEFQQLSPEIQQIVQQFVQQLLEKAQGQPENPAAEQFGQEGSQAPTNQNPNPANTSNIATNPGELPQGSTRGL